MEPSMFFLFLLLSLSCTSSKAQIPGFSVPGRLRDYEIVVTYTWTGDFDLDTKTSFANENVGYRCGASTTYLMWRGDGRSQEKKETTTFKLNKAVADGRVTSRAVLDLSAHWHSRKSLPNSRPKVTVTARRNGSQVGTSVEAAIRPGLFVGCSRTPVATVTITENNGVQINLVSFGAPRPPVSRVPIPTAWQDPNTPHCATIYGDPHLVTFQRLGYSCQGEGEFTLARRTIKDSPGDVTIQGRFSPINNPRATYLRGIAFKFGPSSKIQFSVPINPSTTSFQLGSNRLAFFVNGEVRPLASGETTLPTGEKITLFANKIEIVVLKNRITIYPKPNSTFTVKLCITQKVGKDFRGLLGRPFVDSNEPYNPFGEWIKPDGTPITVPRDESERRGKPGYDYCVQNWCIRNERDSLFTYEAGSTFSSISKCNRPFNGGIDTTRVPGNIVARCGGSLTCLTDAALGGAAAATDALVDEVSIREEAAVGRAISFTPASFSAQASTTITVTVNGNMVEQLIRSSSSSRQLSIRQAAAQISSVQRYELFEYDFSTRQRGAKVVDLQRSGSGSSIAFRARFTERFEAAGQSKSYKAFPVIRGSRNENSRLTQSIFEGVKSFSRRSGVVADSAETGIAKISSNQMNKAELLVRVTWPANKRDLDMAVSHLGTKVGPDCSTQSPYISNIRDVARNGGSEEAIISLGRSLRDRNWTMATAIQVFAGWADLFGARKDGPASLRVSLRDEDTKREFAGTSFEAAVSPGSQFSCAKKVVADVVIRKDGSNFIVEFDEAD